MLSSYDARYTLALFHTKYFMVLNESRIRNEKVVGLEEEERWWATIDA